MLRTDSEMLKGQLLRYRYQRDIPLKYIDMRRNEKLDYILEYFKKTVETYPDREAVDDGMNCYNWQELHFLAQHIASAVAEKSIAGRPIPVFMEKSADAVAAFLGIITAGCFYVYLNPDLPEERIRRMLEVLDADILIVDEQLKKRLVLVGFQGNLLGIEKAKAKPIQMKAIKVRGAGIQNKDYLYGIFTSGSTGIPKNVVVSHQAVLDFMEDFCQEFPVKCHDILGNQAPFDFDVSVKDIYLSVITGAKLVLIPRRMFAEPALLLDYLCEKRVTVLIWAASALCIVSGMRGFEYRIPGLIRRVMFSGEVMPQKQLKIWMKSLPKAEFVNLYGPTEVTCNCTYYRVTGREPEHVPLPIGIPFAKRNVFLLNEYDMPVMADGILGEICVGGATLADGYYRNEAETSKRFTRSPVKSHAGMTIYRTGDLGIYDNRGNLCFTGRKDFQIKRMGHRIELQEIEHECSLIDGIWQVCCDYDGKDITVFYVGEAENGQVRRLLKERLPRYMLPGHFVNLQSMPLNKNGKIDREYLKVWKGGA